MAKKKGAASTALCPDRGMVYLVSRDRKYIMVNTNCKTWGCLSCRERLLRVFKMRVQAGVLGLGRCVFITATFRWDEKSQRNAQYVAKVWKALWRRFKKFDAELSQMKWLRVVELTKKRQPHLHLVMGTCLTQIRCYGRDFDEREFSRRFDSCQCLSHRFSRHWFAVTGDSYICHATPVTSSRGAGAYLAKYMRKDMVERPELERLGFIRRWSSSRGFPGAGRMRLKYTVEKKWLTTFFRHGLVVPSTYEAGKYPELEERVGPDLVAIVSADENRRMGLGKIKKLAHGIQNVGQEARPAGSGRGD